MAQDIDEREDEPTGEELPNEAPEGDGDDDTVDDGCGK
jgi:hypothetical protein